KGKEALAQLREAVRADLEAGRYRAAVDKTRTPDAAIVAMSDGPGEVQKLLDQVLSAARERLGRERAGIQERLAKNDVAGAAECARRAQASVPDVLAPHALELARMVEGHTAAPKEPLPPDATLKVDPTSFKAMISERIRGAITVEGGGVVAIDYHTGDAALGNDLRDFGKRVRVRGGGEGEAGPPPPQPAPARARAGPRPPPLRRRRA